MRQPGALGEDDAEAVADVEGLGLAPVGQEEHRPVGEHAVHVGEDEAERAAARGQAPRLSHIISVFQRSWRCTTPSTTPSASTTGSDVILRSSITARAARGELAPAHGQGARRHALARPSGRAACSRAAPSGAAGRRPRSCPAAGPSASTTVVMPSRFLVISKSTSFIGASGAHARDPVARLHHVLDAHQLLAEAAAGVEHGEVLDGEAAPLEERPWPARRPWPGRRWWRRWGRGRTGRPPSGSTRRGARRRPGRATSAGCRSWPRSGEPRRRIQGISASISSVSPL